MLKEPLTLKQAQSLPDDYERLVATTLITGMSQLFDLYYQATTITGTKGKYRPDFTAEPLRYPATTIYLEATGQEDLKHKHHQLSIAVEHYQKTHQPTLVIPPLVIMHAPDEVLKLVHQLMFAGLNLDAAQCRAQNLQRLVTQPNYYEPI